MMPVVRGLETLVDVLPILPKEPTIVAPFTLSFIPSPSVEGVTIQRKNLLHFDLKQWFICITCKKWQEIAQHIGMLFCWSCQALAHFHLMHNAQKRSLCNLRTT